MVDKNALNREEIESLLDKSDSDSNCNPDVALSEITKDSSLPKYDFSKPYNISRNFEKNLLSMCEAYGRAATLGLTRDYRTTCKVEFAGLKVLSFEDYYNTLDNPSCISTVSLKPLQGNALMQIDIALAFTLIKKLLGGKTETENDIRRFTDIEMGIAGNIATTILGYLKIASEKFVTLDPKHISIETNPEYLNVPSPGESMLSLNFEVKIRDIVGQINLCIPAIAFEPVRDQFDPEDEFVQRDASELEIERDCVRSTIEDTYTELVVKMTDLELPYRQIEGLKEDSVIELDKSINSSLVIELQGKPVFNCKAGQVNKKRAVELTAKVVEDK